MYIYPNDVKTTGINIGKKARTVVVKGDYSCVFTLLTLLGVLNLINSWIPNLNRGGRVGTLILIAVFSQLYFAITFAMVIVSKTSIPLYPGCQCVLM